MEQSIKKINESCTNAAVGFLLKEFWKHENNCSKKLFLKSCSKLTVKKFWIKIVVPKTLTKNKI